MKGGIAAIALAACSTRAPAIVSCESPLGGVYTGESGRWMILDNRFPDDRPRTLEIYPLFADPPIPRVIDLDADGAGFVRRRYESADRSCTGRVPAKLTRCEGDIVELVLADPVPPTSFEPCAFPRPAQSRRERWQLLR